MRRHTARTARCRPSRLLGAAMRQLTLLAAAITISSFAPGAVQLATHASAEEEKPIVLLTEAAHPPYNYLNEKGEMVGFEIDLMNAICARIRRSCQFKHREFDRLVPALLAGKGDAIVSSLDVTDERRDRFTLSEPYFRMPALFVARKDEVPNALTPEALSNVSIGALRDSPFASLVESRFPNSPLSTYATQIEANLDLAADRVDLVIGDEMSLRDWLKTAPEASCCTAAGRVDDPDRVAGEGFAIVFRKGEETLKQKFDLALNQARADGTYASLAKRYFDFEPL
ncbi:MAG: transporter substrate-binding domain-containing protein [Hyphomicrobiales bacterium]|nr:transporter substrate-binding domain-containing protein [Hyphomicrobiales bacterium]